MVHVDIAMFAQWPLWKLLFFLLPFMVIIMCGEGPTSTDCIYTIIGHFVHSVVVYKFLVMPSMKRELLCPLLISVGPHIRF